MMNELIFVTGLFGLLFGSFANVCVYRIPRGESIVSPGSHCPNCQHPIAFYDNIPLLSWLLLRGECRYCHTAIRWRYPFLELLMGVSWGWLAWHYGLSAQLPVAVTLLSLLWVLSIIDLETFLLPDLLTLPGIVVGVGFSIWLGNWQDAVLGALLGYAVLWLVAKLFLRVTGQEGMGQGDFKLLAMLGAFMGWQALPFIIFASSLAGTLLGALLLWRSKRDLRSEIPFGPYLAAAGMVWFLWHDAILDWYLHVSGMQG